MYNFFFFLQRYLYLSLLIQIYHKRNKDKAESSSKTGGTNSHTNQSHELEER